MILTFYQAIEKTKNQEFFRSTICKKIQVGVLGTGRIGKIHLQNLYNHKQISIKGVADPFIDESFVQGLALKGYKDKESILNDKQIEAVFICTPSNTHYELIKEALKAKKAVFCEKPVDLDLHRILEIKKQLDNEGGFLQVGFNRRYDANFQRIAQLIKANEIGELLQISITSRDFKAPPRSYVEGSGGMFLDMSIHDFDLLRFLSQSEVSELFVNASNLVSDYADIDVDSALINLTLKNKAQAIIINCREAVYGYDQRVEVFGKKARAFCENKYENSVQLCNATNQSRQNPLDFFLERYANSYKKELDDFVRALSAKQKPSVGIEESLQATLIALAAIKSAKEKRLIYLDELKKDYKGL